MRKEVGLLLVLHASLVPLSLEAGELIDPTRPPLVGKARPSDGGAGSRRGWTLESTLVAERRRVALINGELVSEGDSVDGARVIEIRELDVVIGTPAGRRVLQLLPDVVEERS